MSALLLAALALNAPAQAGELNIFTSGPVSITVDGQWAQVGRAGVARATDLAGGSHLVELWGPRGRRLAASWIDVPQWGVVQVEQQGRMLTVADVSMIQPPQQFGYGQQWGQVQGQWGYGYRNEQVTVDVRGDRGRGRDDRGHGHARPQHDGYNWDPSPSRVENCHMAVQEPVVYAMDEARLANLLRAVDGEPFSDDKLDLLRLGTREQYVTIAQVGRMMDAMTFPDDKVEVARMLQPWVLDPENAWQLNEHLTFSSSKSEVQRLFL